MPATKFESLLEAVPDALVGMDQRGMIRFVNRQSEALFGYDRDDLIGRPVEALLPEPLWEVYAGHRENYFADSRTRSSGVELELSGRHAMRPPRGTSSPPSTRSVSRCGMRYAVSRTTRRARRSWTSCPGRHRRSARSSAAGRTPRRHAQ